MTAKTTAERSEKSDALAKLKGAEKLRLTAYPGTRDALAELMRRGGYTTQAECMSTMLINLAAMPEHESAAALKCLRHVFEISENVARNFQNESLAILRKPAEDAEDHE